MDRNEDNRHLAHTVHGVWSQRGREGEVGWTVAGEEWVDVVVKAQKRRRGDKAHYRTTGQVTVKFGES